MLPQQLTHRMLIRYHPVIGHLYVPTTFIRIPDKHEPYFIKTNKQGFRSNFDYFKNKTLDKRIVFLGDSFTAGDGLSNEQRFSDLLPQSFERFESYNFGLSGSGIDQQILIYETIVKNYEHDIICFSPHLMDIDRLGSTRLYIEGNTGDIYKIPKPYFSLDNKKLTLCNVPVPLGREKINNRRRGILSSEIIMKFYEKAPKIVREKVSKRFSSKIYRAYEDKSSYSWKLTHALIYRLVEKSEKKTVILCPIPDVRFGININYQPNFLEIQNDFDNVFFIDLAKYFKKFSKEERWAMRSPSSRHLNTFGHQVVAGAIKSSLRDKIF